MIQLILFVWQNIRHWFWRLRKFWRSVYYGITNLLMILGAALILSAIWYHFFIR